MALREKVLELIKKNQPTSEAKVIEKFGDAGKAVLIELMNERLVSEEWSSPDLSSKGLSYPFPDSLHITGAGDVHLTDFEEVETRKKKNDRWTRSLAIIAILISLAALAVSWISMRQEKSSPTQSPSEVASATPNPSAVPNPSP